MTKFTIKTTEKPREYSDCIKIYAVDENDEPIFGANVELRDVKYQGWTINWGSCGAETYQDKLPKFKVIEAGMKKLKELNNK